MTSNELAIRAPEVAARLGVSVSTVRRLTAAGEIPCARVGGVVVYPIAALEAWLAEKGKA